MASHSIPRPSADDIKTTRLTVGASQSTVAAAIGVTYKTLGKWERGGDIEETKLAALVKWMRKHGWQPTIDAQVLPQTPMPLGSPQGRPVEMEALLALALERQRLVTSALQSLGEVLSLAADKARERPDTAAGLQSGDAPPPAKTRTAGSKPRGASSDS